MALLRLVTGDEIPPVKRKPYTIDIKQIEEDSTMMSVDACLPVPVVMQLLKLLEPYQ